MFTGLVAAKGTVDALDRTGGGARLRVTTELAAQIAEGDSVAVNGVCLTAVERDGGSFAADVVAETLSRSSLARLTVGDEVNLELALRASDRLGGHIVQGHVDGIAAVASVEGNGSSRVLRIEAASELLRYVVEKGSVALDGVSLTVAQVDGGGFAVALVPETLARTTLGSARPGETVNVEVDVLAKYVEKLAP